MEVVVASIERMIKDAPTPGNACKGVARDQLKNSQGGKGTSLLSPTSFNQG
jgi:hypothetical protein